MSNLVHADARKRIDTVVTRYRENEGADNFTYEVKDKFVISNRALFILTIPGALNMANILTTTNETSFYFSLTIVAVVLLFLAFPLIAHFCKAFQERVWHDDYVSEDDILYLCDNDDLKLVIAEQLKAGIELTYSDLHKNTDDYIERSDWLRKQEMQKELLSKISQI